MFTTAATVTALWATIEFVSLALAEDMVNQVSSPISTRLKNWVDNKLGWKDHERRRIFLEVYHQAENALIKKMGLTSAYQIFRLMPNLVDDASLRETIIFATFETNDKQQIELLTHSTKSISSLLTSDDHQSLVYFLYCLREGLANTDEFRPLVEFYLLEEARRARSNLLQKIASLESAIDIELRAVRVTLIEPQINLYKEQEVYLKQLEMFYEEQEFLGIPHLEQKKQPLLLKDIYVPLEIQYQNGGESLTTELGDLVFTKIKD